MPVAAFPGGLGRIECVHGTGRTCRRAGAVVSRCAAWQSAPADVLRLAGRLACSDDRFVQWAEAVGAECNPIPESEKKAMVFRLNAVVAHLYGLTEAHVRHIFETFHEGWDYHARLDAVLRYYRAWAGQRGARA